MYGTYGYFGWYLWESVLQSGRMTNGPNKWGPDSNRGKSSWQLTSDILPHLAIFLEACQKMRGQLENQKKERNEEWWKMYKNVSLQLGSLKSHDWSSFQSFPIQNKHLLHVFPAISAFKNLGTLTSLRARRVIWSSGRSPTWQEISNAENQGCFMWDSPNAINKYK